MRRAVFIACLVVICTRPVFACSCGRWPSVTEGRQRAQAVFEGTVIQKEPILASAYGSWFVVERWTFAVERSWKGEATRITVTEGYSNCSLRFALGERALVFAYRHEERAGELGASMCQTPRGTPEEWVGILGQPQSVSPRQHVFESRLGRALRHGRVYGLISLSLARNAIVERRAWGGWFGVFALLLSSLGVIAGLVATAILRRPAAFMALAIGCGMLLTSVYLVGRSYTRGGYFGHLVEYECRTCPGG